MTDVHELLARTQRVLGEAEAPLDPTAHDHLLSGIRRRRRRRHVGEALGVTAGVLVLSTVAWLGLGRADAPLPADRPTTNATAAPTAGPTPTPAPTTDPVLEPAPGAAGLLPAYVLPEGTLEAATAGWVLTTQRPTYLTAESTDAVTAHVLDLVSPDGERYRVLDLPNDVRVSVVRWTAGEPEALVTVGSNGTGTSGPARLDLRTGDLTALDGLGDYATYVARTSTGADLWRDETDHLVVHDGRAVVSDLGVLESPVVDASGTWVAGRDGDQRPVVVHVESGQVQVVPAGEECRPAGWRGADLVLLTCMDDSGAYPVVERFLTYDRDGDGRVDEVEVTGVDGLPQGGTADLGDGRVATSYTRSFDCADGWGVLDPDSGALTPVPSGASETLFTLRAAEGSVYVEASVGCSGDAAPSRLLRHDVATGATVELAAPPPAADLPAGSGDWMVGTSSWVVGD